MLWKRDLKFGRVGAFLVEINTDLVKLLASGRHGCTHLEEPFSGRLLRSPSAEALATAPSALQQHPGPPAPSLEAPPCPCESRSGVVTAGSARVGCCSSLASLKALYKRQHHLYLNFPLAVGVTCLSLPVVEQGTELRSTWAMSLDEEKLRQYLVRKESVSQSSHVERDLRKGHMHACLSHGCAWQYWSHRCISDEHVLMVRGLTW